MLQTPRDANKTCALKEMAKMRKEHANNDTVNRGLDVIEVFALQILLVDDPE